MIYNIQDKLIAQSARVYTTEHPTYTACISKTRIHYSDLYIHYKCMHVSKYALTSTQLRGQIWAARDQSVALKNVLNKTTSIVRVRITVMVMVWYYYCMYSTYYFGMSVHIARFFFT